MRNSQFPPLSTQHSALSTRLAASVCILLASSAFASAQPVYNPIIASPFARPTLSPYLNLSTSGTAASTYYMGVLGEIERRNYLLRPPILLGQDFLAGFDPYRSPGYQSVAGYQSAEDWVNQRIRETQLTPTGHPTGFLIQSPFYRLPNQRSFIPYNPNVGQQVRP
jgi:hypothetical protein